MELGWNLGGSGEEQGVDPEGITVSVQFGSCFEPGFGHSVALVVFMSRLQICHTKNVCTLLDENGRRITFSFGGLMSLAHPWDAWLCTYLSLSQHALVCKRVM